MQPENRLLTEEEIESLDQNYISSDSDFFIRELQSFFKDYSNIDDSDDNLENKFENLYILAKKINPAALPYSQMTTLIFEDDNLTESIEMFIMYLDEFIKNKFETSKEHNTLSNNDKVSITVLSKAKEHLNLAYAQKQSLYSKQKSELNNLIKQLEQEKQTITELKQETQEYKSKYNKLTIDFLSMMGVFSTIIFAVFGGLSQIGAIGDNLAETPIPKILMYISLSSITLIFIVFLSFNAIAKLTGMRLRSCQCPKDGECKHNIFEKHPSLSLGLLFFLDLFIFSIVLKMLGIGNWFTLFSSFNLESESLSKTLPVFSFILVNLLLVLIFFITRLKKK